MTGNNVRGSQTCVSYSRNNEQMFHNAVAGQKCRLLGAGGYTSVHLRIGPAAGFSSPGPKQRNRRKPVPVPVTGVRYNSLL